MRRSPSNDLNRLAWEAFPDVLMNLELRAFGIGEGDDDASPHETYAASSASRALKASFVMAAITPHLTGFENSFLVP